jgi:hypothetical protein
MDALLFCIPIMTALRISQTGASAHVPFLNGTVLLSHQEKSLHAEEIHEDNLIMVAPTTSSFVLQAAADTAPVHLANAGRKRRIDRESGRALEILAHAIEYLADEYVHHGGQFKANDGEIRAMQLLMAANRSIYAACPVIPTFEERCTSFLRRLWNPKQVTRRRRHSL